MWAHIKRNFVLSPRQLSCDFGLKPLKCFWFLPPRVCPLVNLPSIKRADPTRYPRSRRKLALIQSLSDPGRMFEFTAIGRVLSTTINYHRFGPTCLLVVGRSERCSLLIALRRQRFSVLSPAAGRRPRHAGIPLRSSPPIRWAARSPGWRRARCVASAEIIPPLRL